MDFLIFMSIIDLFYRFKAIIFNIKTVFLTHVY